MITWARVSLFSPLVLIVVSTATLSQKGFTNKKSLPPHHAYLTTIQQFGDAVQGELKQSASNTQHRSPFVTAFFRKSNVINGFLPVQNNHQYGFSSSPSNHKLDTTFGENFPTAISPHAYNVNENDESTEELTNGDFAINDNENYDDFKRTHATQLTGPHQIETIESEHYHRKVKPFDVSEFKKNDHHGHHAKHGEVHYHEHKHIHEHDHKQEHKHEHKQSHKHEHQHHQKHKHSHKQEHKHEHDHHQDHKHDHHHQHHQDHKHHHHHDHKHKHGHEQKHDHKHEHKHGHDHHHDNDHKHGHNHHHGHGHEHDHKHSEHD